MNFFFFDTHTHKKKKKINLGIAESVAAGAELAMLECQWEFRWERWPCPRQAFTKRY